MPRFLVTIKNEPNELFEQRFAKRPRDLLKDPRVIYVEEDDTGDHDWERVLGRAKLYQCKCCGLYGVKEDEGIRVSGRLANERFFVCSADRLLPNTVGQEKFISRIRNEGFSEG